jgi:hypothetical protein
MERASGSSHGGFGHRDYCATLPKKILAQVREEPLLAMGLALLVDLGLADPGAQ